MFTRGALDRDFDQEWESHLDMLTEHYVRRGMGREQARRTAVVELGPRTQFREAHRAIRGLPFLDALGQDLRYAARGMRKHPGFAAGAVLTLAIGMAVNTAVFTMFNSLVLRRIQAPDPDRLVQLTRSDRERFFSYSAYAYYRDNNHSLSGLAAIAARTFALGGVSTPPADSPTGIAAAAGFHFVRTLTAQAGVVGVSGDYFTMLGVTPALGRTFSREEDTAEAHSVALISDHFWERQFARDPGVLGRPLTLNGVSVTVVGITPRDWSGTEPSVPDLWVPLALHARISGTADLLRDRSDCCRLYGRLQPGIQRPQAEAEINTLARRFRLPEDGNPAVTGPARIVLSPASPFGPSESGATFAGILLLGAVSSILLIACANVAGLLLARAAARQREIAVRLAIGASRGRLVRQLITENAVMSLLAGSAGLVLSWWSLNVLMLQIAAILPGYLSAPALHLVPDHRVFMYTLFLSAGATCAFGLAPALEASRPNLSSALKDDGAIFGGSLRKSRLRDVMMGGQVAVCVVLLIAASLLARASQRTLDVDLGFDYRHIVLLDVSYPRTASPAAVAALRTQLAQQMEALPEVQSVAVASLLPLAGTIRVINVAPTGGALNDPGTQDSFVTLVTPNYFETMGIPIRRGRPFKAEESRDGSDFGGSPVIVSEATARRFWPGQDPLGKRFAFGACRDCRILPIGEQYPHSVASIVVGIATDVQGRNLDRVDGSLLYLPVTRASWGSMVMRVRGDEHKAVAAIEREFRATHSDLEATTWDSRTVLTNQSKFIIARAGAIGAAIIGILGVLMASVGIYGTVGFAVAQRTQEIGIRMALGAQRGDVVSVMLSETMRPVAAGLAIGVVCAAVLARLASSLLFGLSALDPLAFLGGAGGLAAVSLLAGYLPARRATRVDTMIALRYE